MTTETTETTTTKLADQDVTTYRGDCSCRQRFGYANDLDSRAMLESIHAKHAKAERRKKSVVSGTNIPEPHTLTVTSTTLAERQAEHRRGEIRWAELLRDRYVPEKRADVYAAIATIAVDLRRRADALDRIVAGGAMLLDDSAYASPMYAVEQTQHEVLWGVANLGLDRLLSKLRYYQDSKNELAEKSHLLSDVQEVK